MINEIIKPAKQGSRFSFGRLLIWLIVGLLITGIDVFAQPYYYELTMNPRRMGNQIGVDLWIRTLDDVNAVNLGNMSIVINYNTTFLSADGITGNDLTDSVSSNIADNPHFINISSNFSDAGGSGYGFANLTGGGVFNNPNYFATISTVLNSPFTGFKPVSTGRGSFIGRIVFNIKNQETLTNTDLTNFTFNTTLVPTPSVMGADNSNQTAYVQFTNPATQMTIRGITVMNPNWLDQPVNRNNNPNLNMLAADGNAGYPIYFERSGLIRVSTSGTNYGTPKLGYTFEYNLNGATPTTGWTEFGRVAEIRDGVTILGANVGNYRSGDIDQRTISPSDFIITQGDGTQLPVATGDGYPGVLRVIWTASENFPLRSENALLRITQLDSSATAMAGLITARSTSLWSLAPSSLDTRRDVSDNTFILGRLFFVQLNGTNSYFRTQYNYSNATQLTVEAWVNLNGTPYPPDPTAAPAIVASSSGPASVDEGAWMLYLDQGKYPAFRCREIEGRSGGYVAQLVAPDSLTVANNSKPIQDAHGNNWNHVAATVNGNVVTLYLNGEIVSQYTNNDAVNIRMLTTNHPIWIGVNPNYPGNPPSGIFLPNSYLNAGIKEVRVWRNALTQDQLRARAAGVYDPAGLTSAINPATGDNRASLELDYTFQAIPTDVASNMEWQNNANPLNYYLTPSITSTASNTAISYRPDRAHIRLTSPSGGEGVSNLNGKAFPVRWIGYGLGSTLPSSKDLMIQVSRDGGTEWFDATDLAGWSLDQVEIEAGQTFWYPYKNATATNTPDDLQGLTPLATSRLDVGAGNYTKTVKLRISGTTDRGQDNIAFTSGNFTVAPNFGLKFQGGSYARIPQTTTTNLSGAAGFIEAWIKPYRMPQGSEYFPIACKMLNTAPYTTHYALRLLSTGQLQLVIGSTTGLTERTAVSLVSKPILSPNQMVFDSSWIHVGAYYNLAGNPSTCYFYIDGTLQDSAALTTQLGSNINVDKNNTYYGYIGYEPGTTNYFIGEVKELRFWSGNPAGLEPIGNAPNPLTRFIQGALTVRADELSSVGGVEYTRNLQAAFIMNGGSFVNSGRQNTVAAYPTSTGLVADIINDPASPKLAYSPTFPLVKLIEPAYKQAVPNTQADLRVRWVGFDYNRNAIAPSDFRPGDATNNSDLQFSVKGGAGMSFTPYMYAASKKYNTSYTDAASLLSSQDKFAFLGTSAISQYAMNLNMSIANPDLNGDFVYNDQGPVPATMTNGRFQLRGRVMLNGYPFEYDNGTAGYMPSLRSETDIFDITPPSNFTVRVLLEGYQRGSATAMPNNIGTSYEHKGLKISLYQNNANLPGPLVATAESSISGYDNDAYDPTSSATSGVARGSDGSRFANVPFVFTSIADSRYFVLVEHLNHLPILSKYAAPFSYTGDDLTTWAVESGWDFQNWNGGSTYISESDAATNPPTIGTNYTAWINGNNTPSKDKTNSTWASTGLNWNQGGINGNSQTAALAAMAAGDVWKDNQIDAADRAYVRLKAGTTTDSTDVDGDGMTGATDRTIVDFNTNKVSSIGPGTLPGMVYSNNDPLSNTLPMAVEMSNKFNETAKNYIANGGETSHTGSPFKANKVLDNTLKYTVFAQPSLSGQYIDIPMYIRNDGSDFALANCSFGVTYDPSSLTFTGLNLSENVIFSNRPDLGYNTVYTSPQPGASNPISGLRTIEIDWDAFTRYPGQNVPPTNTYLGTLRFQVTRSLDAYTFNWHKITCVLTTEGKNVTGNGNFMPIPAIMIQRNASITVPNGNETWRAGQLYTISWTQPNASGMVNIQYSPDNGNTWNNITTTSVDIKTLNYNWATPRISSSECLVRLVDASTGLEIDRSDATFSLLPSPVEIVRPSGKDPIYRGGSSDYIRWYVDNPTNVRFEFSENGLNGWTSVSATINSTNEQVSWTLPRVNTKTAIVRMVNVQTGEVMTQTSSFRVLTGSVSFTSPKAGDILTVGKNAAIKWQYDNLSRFDLQMTHDGQTWTSVSRDVIASKGNMQWLVPDLQTQNATLVALWNNDPEMEYGRVEGFKIVNNTGVDNPGIDGFAFEQAVPNPFENSTMISFRLPFDEYVTINVYNSLGQKVMSLADGVSYPSGTHSLTLEGSNLPVGVYFVHLTAGSFTMTQQIVKQ